LLGQFSKLLFQIIHVGRLCLSVTSSKKRFNLRAV
jgi:hypothetical protein